MADLIQSLDFIISYKNDAWIFLIVRLSSDQIRHEAKNLKGATNRDEEWKGLEKCGA